MQRHKIFISSVQREFEKERKALVDYLLSDSLLGKFFDPFIFEQVPAIDHSVEKVYLKEVEACSIYLGILGKDYGYEGKSGISPTEREFDHASLHHKTRLIFISNTENRHPKELAFINKVQNVLVRRSFSSLSELKSHVYSSLVKYLMEKEIIRTAPFDASLNRKASLDDIDNEKIKRFVKLARAKRGFPLQETAEPKIVLTHLNLIENESIKNAAILLFGKHPQRFFINSEIRCASFYGNKVEKPIPSYKVFKGDVFELVDQAVEFVLSKLDYRIETRKEETSIPGSYEIPKEIIAEAIVNAVAHRDYTSNASIQVMVFRDRVEIWNPGSLPMGWTIDKLKELHNSVPANPLLAEPMYLAAYIERLGTGTTDMIEFAQNANLPEPQFIQDDQFRTIIYRHQKQLTEILTGQVSGQVTEQLPVEVRKLVLIMSEEMKRAEIQAILQLKHRDYFMENYLNPALKEELIALTFPENPSHPHQKYTLTEKGKICKIALLHNLIEGESMQDTMQDTVQDTMQDTMQVNPQIKQLIEILKGEMSRDELQECLNLQNRDYFRKAFILEALNQSVIEMTIPEKPTSKNQKYRLTEKGKQLKTILKKN